MRWNDLLELLARYPRTSLVIAVLLATGAAIAYWPFGVLEAIGGVAAALLQLAALKVIVLFLIDVRCGATRPPILPSVLFVFGCLAVALALASPILLRA